MVESITPLLIVVLVLTPMQEHLLILQIPAIISVFSHYHFVVIVICYLLRGVLDLARCSTIVHWLSLLQYRENIWPQPDSAPVQGKHLATTRLCSSIYKTFCYNKCGTFVKLRVLSSKCTLLLRLALRFGCSPLHRIHFCSQKMPAIESSSTNTMPGFVRHQEQMEAEGCCMLLT